jgi:hypothetical protein
MPLKQRKYHELENNAQQPTFSVFLAARSDISICTLYATARPETATLLSASVLVERFVSSLTIWNFVRRWMAFFGGRSRCAPSKRLWQKVATAQNPGGEFCALRTCS